MKHPHYDPIAFVRDSMRETDHALRAIVANYRRGLLGEPQAIQQLRAAGACEPEIAEALGV